MSDSHVLWKPKTPVDGDRPNFLKRQGRRFKHPGLRHHVVDHVCRRVQADGRDPVISLASWAARYPRTARAFTTAVGQGNRIAATDPAVLQRTLEKQLHLNANVVDVMGSGADHRAVTLPAAT